MFDNETDKNTEQARSHALLVVGAIAVLVLTALIVLLARSKPESVSVVENIVRAGAPEFDSYQDKIELETTDKITYDNWVGMFQIEVKARLHNRGDRPLTAVELLGKMFDMEDRVLAQRVSLPIPRLRKEPLKPGESMNVSVKVDAPGKISEGEVKDVTIELSGLRFQ